ncbi:MAG: hypothetical protein PHH13_01505 [Candidatus Peribacteraceae bacterium]|nr:hypothetical protein [Candidatus Peribacteraceae bacterium]
MEILPPLSSGQRVLRNAETYVAKIGGENAADLRSNTAIVARRAAEGKKQIIAVSALRSSSERFDHYAHGNVVDHDSTGRMKHGFNTTSHLIELAKRLQAGDRKSAHDILERIRTFTKEIVAAQVQDDPMPDAPEACRGLHAAIDRILDVFLQRIDACDGNKIAQLGADWILKDTRECVSITGVGEALAQAIYATYFTLKNLPAHAVDTGGIGERVFGSKPENIIANERQTALAIETVRRAMQNRIARLLPAHSVLIAGGYLPILGSQRGYSDKTGALLAQAAKDAGEWVAYLVEKQYPIMSADPKHVGRDRATVIHDMTFALAMEAFGNTRGADGGAIHPQALSMLAEDDIDTLVFNPAEDPALNRITHIRRFDPQSNGIEIVAARKMPVALEMRSTKMFGQAGFLSTVTAWFAERGISIDQVTTSEVTVSFTFTNGDLKPQETEEFQTFLQEHFGPDRTLALSIIRDKTLLYCLGNNMKQSGPALSAVLALHNVDADIRLISQGFNELVMTFAVDSDKALPALKRLHEVCIERKGNP